MFPIGKCDITLCCSSVPNWDIFFGSKDDKTIPIGTVFLSNLWLKSEIMG